MVLIRHWSWDPFLFVTLAVALWHEHGLRHLLRRSSSHSRNAARRRQSLLFYAGLGVLDLTVASPVDYYSDLYFWVHQVQHLLLMFGAPVLIVAGAPWLPLVHGLPIGARRRLGRALLLGHWSAPLRLAGRTAARPWVAIVGFNVVMVTWHVPALFDLAFRHQAVHIWLMHGSFFVAGIAFWCQFIGSYPLRPRLPPLARAGALFGTNVVMFFLAVTLGMLATTPWYPVYVAHAGAALSPLGDQHLGAGILWVCGDFWCLPALTRAIRQFIREDDAAGVDRALDRLLQGTR